MHTPTPDFQPARVLDGYVCLSFLPALFGDDCIRVENNVYLYASRYLDGYDGSVWAYAALPEGAAL